MKKILLPLLLTSFITISSHGIVNLTFSYNATTGDTTASYSGFWADFSTILSGSLNISLISSTQFFSLSGGEDRGSDNFNGTTFAWGSATADSRTGDVFGFDGNYIYAESTYTQGDDINGLLFFEDTSLTDLGLVNGQSATYLSTTGNNSINFNAVQVPEPSTYAAVAGFAILGLAFWRRMRKV